MGCARLALILGLTVAGVWAQPALELLQPGNRSVSSSRQFNVYGGTRELRAEVARRAEEIKEAVLQALGRRDAWKDPVVLVLAETDGIRMRQEPVRLGVFDSGEAGRKVQVDFTDFRSIDPVEVDRALVRAVLLEMGLRGLKGDGGAVFAYPPEWLVAAILQAAKANPMGGDAGLYAGIIEGGKLPGLARFLASNPAEMRGQAAEIHAAQAHALLEALSALPSGREKLASYAVMRDAPADPLARFHRVWPPPEGSEARVARLWAMSAARLASARKLEPRSAAETSKSLAEALRLRVPEGMEPDAPAAWVALSRTKEGRFTLEQAAVQLRRLGFRAHPLYAPVVEEYRAIMEGLARGRRGRVEQKVGELVDLTAALNERTAAMTDYLDWFQATQAGGSIRRETAAVLAPPEEESPGLRRQDAISRWIDSVEQRGW